MKCQIILINMNNPELSIIVTGYKNPELLKLCIDSIKKNIVDIEYELIVVDSATEEDTELMMREYFPKDKFFPFEKNVGLQKLVKKGISESVGDFLLMLNGDILIKENSVEELLRYLKTNPLVGMVGPKLLSFNGEFQDSCFRFYKPVTIVYRRTFLGKFKFAKKHLSKFLMKDYDHKEPREVDWLMGSALMMPKKAIEKVGGMDPRFFLYMEDVDWCRRFWENGLKVVHVPNSMMLHYHGKGSGKRGLFYSVLFNKLTWIHISSAIKYFKKYLGKPNPRDLN
jgi:N-acetylglucosaminyl-diphospho-decaprenol L-rhamnosyltransferase